MVHEKLRPFKCESCGKGFAEKSKLKIHVQAVHEKLKLHNCGFCDKCYALKKDLKYHLKTVHENSKESTKTNNSETNNADFI